MRIFSPIVTGSLNASGSFYVTGSVSSMYGFTGSLFGTASYALTASLLLGDLFQIATGSVTASVDVDSNKIFLIRNYQNTVLSVDSTGSLTTSGSVRITTTGSFDQLFGVSNDGTDYLKINGEGVVVLHRYSTPPTVVTGGLYFDDSGNVYVGD